MYCNRTLNDFAAMTETRAGVKNNRTNVSEKVKNTARTNSLKGIFMKACGIQESGKKEVSVGSLSDECVGTMIIFLYGILVVSVSGWVFLKLCAAYWRLMGMTA